MSLRAIFGLPVHMCTSTLSALNYCCGTFFSN